MEWPARVVYVRERERARRGPAVQPWRYLRERSETQVGGSGRPRTARRSISATAPRCVPAAWLLAARGGKEGGFVEGGLEEAEVRGARPTSMRSSRRSAGFVGEGRS